MNNLLLLWNNKVQGSFCVIDFLITPLKVLLNSIMICWLCEERIPAGPLLYVDAGTLMRKTFNRDSRMLFHGS